MTDHEKAFNQWKADTRREALEKEIERLQTENRKKDTSLLKFKMALILVILATAASWTIFLFTNNKTASSPKNSKLYKNSATLPDSGNLVARSVPNKGTNQTKKIEIINPSADTIEFFIPEDGIFFSTQIGAFTEIDLNEFSNNMVALHQYSNAGINQFTLGIFSDYDQAIKFRNFMRKIGLKDAYITAIRDGHRINVQEALNIRLQTPLPKN